ncbi:MAG: ornithine cyclodeaminase family protein [Candidatus Latescibacterota bacterium]
MAQILVIRNEEFEPHVRIADCIPLVEEAFRAIALGQADHPAKYHDITSFGLWFYMGGHVPSREAMAIKLGCAPPGKGSCQVILYDHVTAEPKALMEGLRVTHLRTGAAAAIGARWLARPDSSVVGLVGAGRVCWHSLMALNECFKLEQVYVADTDKDAGTAFVERARAAYPFPVHTASVEEAVAAADIVVTATPSRTPVVQAEWVRPGTHFSAMGADGKGKQELDSALHVKARVVCDDVDQCLKWGDINNSVGAGLVGRAGLVGSIGEVLLGRKPGRTSPEEITLFDATGMGIQDAAVAKLIYDTARRLGLGTEVTL